jgi:hypothetical protein
MELSEHPTESVGANSAAEEEGEGRPALPPHLPTPFGSDYRALHTEQGVFTTPPYSEAIKDKWRFQDEAIATKSAKAIYAMFEVFRWVVSFDTVRS